MVLCCVVVACLLVCLSLFVCLFVCLFVYKYWSCLFVDVAANIDIVVIKLNNKTD